MKNLSGFLTSGPSDAQNNGRHANDDSSEGTEESDQKSADMASRHSKQGLYGEVIQKRIQMWRRLRMLHVTNRT